MSVFLGLILQGCGIDSKFGVQYQQGLNAPNSTAVIPAANQTPSEEIGKPIQVFDCNNEVVNATIYPPHRISADGSGLSSGLGNGLSCTAPILSRDGRMLFFRSNSVNLLRGKRKRITTSVLWRDVVYSKKLSGAGEIEPVVPLQGSEVAAPFDGPQIPTAVSSDGQTRVLFGISRDPSDRTRSLTGLYVQRGSNPTVVYAKNRNINGYALSSDGQTLFWSDFTTTYRIELSTGQERLLGPGRISVFQQGGNLSVDGTKLLTSLGVLNTTSGDVVHAFPSGFNPNSPSNIRRISLTPDGQSLLFDTTDSLVPADTNSNRDCYRLSLQDGSYHLLTSRADGSATQADTQGVMLSDDGRWALFSSLDALISADINPRLDLYLKDLVTNELTRITPKSKSSSSPAILDSIVLGPTYAMSGDASVVAFTSDLSDITPGDDNNGVDVFTWRRASGGLTRETISERGENAYSPGASLFATLNADGTKAAFSTTSTRIVPVATRQIQELGDDLHLSSEAYVVRWSNGGGVEPVHISSNGMPTGTYASRQEDLAIPEMDGAGQKVLYSQPLTDIVHGIGVDIFLRDFSEFQSQLLGHGIVSDIGFRIVDTVRNLSISLDGKEVAYPKDTRVGQAGSVVRRNLSNSSEVTIAAGLLGTFPRGSSVCLNARGDVAVFATDRKLTADDKNDQMDIYLWKSSDGSYTRLSPSSPTAPGDFRGSFSPTISGDGKWVAFRSTESLLPAKPGNIGDVYLYNVELSQLDNLSYSPSGSGQLSRGLASPFHDYYNFLPPQDVKLSFDGRYLCFISYYDNLSTDDHNGESDVYVFDRIRCAFCLVSRGADLKSPDGGSLACSISADGQWIVFDSDSADLVEGDDNLVSDVFRVRNPLYVPSN